MALQGLCRDCIYKLFNPTWGEYKCIKKQRTITDKDQKSRCAHYRSESKHD